MWLDSALAPALVPATTAPWRNWSSTASASRVPPIVDDSRSWLPPVRKMPVALRMARAAFSSLAWARVIAWIVPDLGHAELAEDLLVARAGLHAQRGGGRDHDDVRVAPAGERGEAAQDDAVADLVLRAADDDDGSLGHGRANSFARFREGYPESRPSRARMPRPWPTRTRHSRRNSIRSPEPRGDAAAVVVDLGDMLGTPTRRRAGVYRRAMRREASRLHDHRRVIAIVLLSLTFSLLAAGMIGRGEAAGADARAYWAGVRIWLNGGDPYHPTGPFLPYVYAPWMLPLFAPWALLPWDVAWVVWRGATILLLLWTVHWAYQRRPLMTAVIVALLAFPVGANLDTGNINLLLTLMLWAAQFTGPRLAGLLWALATWMKWVPVFFWVVLAPRATRAGAGLVVPGGPVEHRPAATDDPAVPGPVRVRGAADPARLPGLPLGVHPVAVPERPQGRADATPGGPASPFPGGSGNDQFRLTNGLATSSSSRRPSTTGRSNSAPIRNHTGASRNATRGPASGAPARTRASIEDAADERRDRRRWSPWPRWRCPCSGRRTPWG